MHGQADYSERHKQSEMVALDDVTHVLIPAYLPVQKIGESDEKGSPQELSGQSPDNSDTDANGNGRHHEKCDLQ